MTFSEPVRSRVLRMSSRRVAGLLVGSRRAPPLAAPSRWHPRPRPPLRPRRHPLPRRRPGLLAEEGVPEEPRVLGGARGPAEARVIEEARVLGAPGIPAEERDLEAARRKKRDETRAPDQDVSSSVDVARLTEGRGAEEMLGPRGVVDGERAERNRRSASSNPKEVRDDRSPRHAGHLIAVPGSDVGHHPDGSARSARWP